jgi:hypothetical protein
MPDPTKVFPVLRDAAGRAVPVVLPEDAEGRRINGLFLIANDLKSCERWFSYLAKNSSNDPPSLSQGESEQQIVARGVWISAVVTYGKCFARADGRRIKLERKAVLALGQSLTECHDRLIKNRDQYAAHGGGTANEHGVFAIAIRSVSPLELEQVGFTVQARAWRREEHELCQSLCQKLREIVTNQSQRAIARFEASLRKQSQEEFQAYFDRFEREHGARLAANRDSEEFSIPMPVRKKE